MACYKLWFIIIIAINKGIILAHEDCYGYSEVELKKWLFGGSLVDIHLYVHNKIWLILSLFKN